MCKKYRASDEVSVSLDTSCTFSDSRLLLSIFESYPRLQPLAQDSLLTLITPLIRSLGATHIKIAEVIEQCPIGAEALVLRLLTILMDKGRLPPGLMTSVKVLASQRPLHPRFYVMFISECSKVCQGCLKLYSGSAKLLHVFSPTY